MDKVKLGFKIPENVTIEYNNIKVSITPYLSMAQMIFLFDAYVNEYFSDNKVDKLTPVSKRRYIEAEVNLKHYILQMVTNVDMTSIDNEIYGDSELWKTIYGTIKNYPEFRKQLDHLVELVKEEITLENSVGTVLSNLIDEALSVIQKIGDISPEEIERLQKTGSDLMQQLQESNLLEDVTKIQAEEK